MNEPSPEDDLKALFARQRNADHQHAPDFHALRARAIASRVSAPPLIFPIRWRWAWPGIAALTLAMAGVFAFHHAAKPPTVSRDVLVRQLDEIDATLQRNLAAQTALTAWQSPTDFLLHSTHHENHP